MVCKWKKVWFCRCAFPIVYLLFLLYFFVYLPWFLSCFNLRHLQVLHLLLQITILLQYLVNFFLQSIYLSLKITFKLLLLSLGLLQFWFQLLKFYFLFPISFSGSLVILHVLLFPVEFAILWLKLLLELFTFLFHFFVKFFFGFI